MYTTNKALFDSISENPADIKQIAWEVEFKPLSYQIVQDIWYKQHKSNNLSLLDRELHHIADRGWLVLHEWKDSHPRYIYPMSLADVVKHRCGDDEFIQKYMSNVSDSIKHIHPYLRV
jgi:hypothetical protein